MIVVTDRNGSYEGGILEWRQEVLDITVMDMDGKYVFPRVE